MIMIPLQVLSAFYLFLIEFKCSSCIRVCKADHTGPVEIGMVTHDTGA